MKQRVHPLLEQATVHRRSRKTQAASLPDFVRLRAEGQPKPDPSPAFTIGVGDVAGEHPKEERRIRDDGRDAEPYEEQRPEVSTGDGAGPWLTVIVPAYNEAEWVGETVRSLREQTRAPAEIIVVDDREKP